VAGYVSGGFYSRSDGKHWIKSMLLTASLFPFASFAIGFLLNTVAIFYHSLAAIPFGTMVSLAFLLLRSCAFVVPNIKCTSNRLYACVKEQYVLNEKVSPDFQLNPVL
jgi:hypothetical protein